MQRLWSIPILGLSFTGAIALSQQPSSQPAAKPVHIEGIVLDGRTNMPLIGVSVGTGVRVMTGEDGKFAVDVPVQPNANVPNLFVTKTGYMAGRPDGRKLPGNSGIPVTLAAGQRLDNFVVRMFPVASISGKVLDPAGQPIQDAMVIPYRYVYNDAGIRSRQNFQTANTNDLGDFRLSNLDTGDYFFEVRPEPLEFGAPGAVLSPTYYPGVVDVTRAMPVHIEGGVRNQLDNMTVVSVHGGTLRIHIVNEAGEAPRGTTILNVSRKGETSGSLLSPPMIPRDVLDEVVNLGRLVPGAYDISAMFATYGAPGTAQGRVSVITTENDTSVDVPVRKVVSTPIHGKAMTEATSNRDARPVQGVQLSLTDFTVAVTGRGGATPLWTSQADGAFPDRNSIVLPGAGLTFRVKVVATPQGMAVVSIRDGDRDVLKDGLRVDAGRSPNVAVTLTETAGQLAGVATDAKGQKIIAGVVLIVPDDAVRSQLLIATSTDLNGEFRFRVVPGAYHLYVWRELDGAAYYDPDFMDSYTRRGTPARVEANVEAKADLKVLE